MSPYNTFDNSPIIVLDPSGADGGTKKNRKTRQHDVKAKMYFQFDDDLFTGTDASGAAWTAASIAAWKTSYIANWKAGLDATWDNRSVGSDGYTINTQTITYQEGTKKLLEQNANTITVTNGTGTMAGNLPSTVISNQIDNVDGFHNSNAIFFASNGNTNVAHEFGHMMGLSERYFEALTATDNDTRNGGKTVQSGRNTVPLMVGDEGATSYLNNVMATGGIQTTDRQENVFLHRWRFEREYVRAFFVLPKNISNGLPIGLRWNGSKYKASNLKAIDAQGIMDTRNPIYYTFLTGRSNAFYMWAPYSNGTQNQNTVRNAAIGLGWINQ